MKRDKVNVIQGSEVSPVIYRDRMDHGAFLVLFLLAIMKATVLRAEGVSSILRTLKTFFHGNIDRQSDWMEATAIISPKTPASKFWVILESQKLQSKH